MTATRKTFQGLLLAGAFCSAGAQEPAAPEAASGPVQPASADTIPVEPVKQSEPEATSPHEPPTQLGDVMVTASKREASSRSLASSVTALTGEKMEDQGLRDVSDIVKQVPGVNIWDNQNGTTPQKITIRGISSDQQTAATAGVFLDETPFTDATVAFSVLDMNPFDLYTVEVLKGPVGTLFGGSALNGAIRYIPQAPKMGEWELKAYGEIGSTHEGGVSRSYGGAVNVPLFAQDDLALRLVAIDRHSTGFMDSTHRSYRKKDINNTDQTSMRALLGWQPLDRLALAAMYVKQETDIDDVLRFTERSDDELTRGITPRASPSSSDYEVYNLKATWSFDWAQLVFNGAQLDKFGDTFADFSYLVQRSGNPLPTAAVTAGYDGTSRVQELRLVSSDDGGDWDWLVGVFNYAYKLDGLAGLIVANDTLQAVLGPLAPLVNRLPVLNGILLSDSGDINALDVVAHYKIAEQAVFGEMNWRFAEDWELTGGLRLYRFTYDIDNTSKGAGCVLTNPTCPATLFVGNSHPTADEPGVNPKLSLKWQAQDNLMTYATLARGYRFGGVNLIPAPSAPPTFKSDSLWNLEGGVRAEWFDRTLITDFSVYAIRWTDAQVSVTDPTLLVVTYVDNVGQVNGKGIEAQITWLTPVEGLRLTFIPAYSDIRTATPFASGTETVPEGTQWPLSPRFAASTSLSWTQVVFDSANLDLSLTHRYMSEAQQQLSGNPAKVFGYATCDFGLTLKSFAGSHWPELAINVNNITDERGVAFRNVNAQLGTLTGYIEPRYVSARLTFRF